MSETDVWFTDPEYPDYRCKIVQYGNVTARVYRPILSDKERLKREKQIMSVVGRILSKYDNLEETI